MGRAAVITTIICVVRVSLCQWCVCVFTGVWTLDTDTHAPHNKPHTSQHNTPHTTPQTHTHPHATTTTTTTTTTDNRQPTTDNGMTWRRQVSSQSCPDFSGKLGVSQEPTQKKQHTNNTTQHNNNHNNNHQRTDYGGNIFCSTLIQMPAIEHIQ